MSGVESAWRVRGECVGVRGSAWEEQKELMLAQDALCGVLVAGVLWVDVETEGESRTGGTSNGQGAAGGGETATATTRARRAS